MGTVLTGGGGGSVLSQTDAHPYGTGLEKYPSVTMQQEYTYVLTTQHFPKKFI